MPCLTVVIDTTIIPKEKIYMPNMHHEDYAAFLNCLRDGAVARGLDEVLASYRVSRSSVSGNKFRTATWQWRILRDQEKLSVFKSFYYLCTYAVKAVRKRL
jgi:teichuronic acid biosynthesis glycosyltransferase TuaG